MSPGPKKQFDRDEVLEKAMHLFWEHGYEATGMTRLVEHVGIGRQSLYDTFGDKRSLYLETLAHYFRTRVGPILAQLRAPGSPLDNVKAVFGLWEKMVETKGFRGCLAGNATAELAHDDPEIADRLAGYFRAVEDAFHDTFERAQQAGELDPGHDPRDLARTFVNTAQGLALLTKVFHGGDIAQSVMRTSLRMLEAG
jgi:TetR/AcrR family transcriptional repressor of nem operon